MEIKDIVYKSITNYEERKIISDIAQGNSPDTINAIVNECTPILVQINGSQSEKIGSLAEVLIHYLLTVALIPSQRKTSFNSIDVDVVIPDISTLMSSPQDALVITFPKTNDIQLIKNKITELIKIQPHKENIWFVLEEELPLEIKTYGMTNNTITSFSNIINDIIWFTSNKKQSKLKIFRI